MRLTLGDAVADVSARRGGPAVPVDFTPRVVTPPASRAHDTTDVFDLTLIARRCRLKADACRWVIERRQRLVADDHDDAVRDRDRQFFAAAKALPACYLWMLDPYGPLLPEDTALEEIAGCYDASVAATELLSLVDQQEQGRGSDVERDAFHLAAEAQSAVRIALERVDRSLIDADQNELFLWLRQEAAEWQRAIRVERYMRRDDGADPAQWPALQQRITEARAHVEQRRGASERRRQMLGKVRYHTDRVRRGGGGGGPAEQDWRSVFAAVEALVIDGLPPSDREVRDRLLPLLDDLPDEEMGPGMTAVLAEIDRYLDQVDREPLETAPRPPSETLIRAREMLGGKVVVLIGGYRREPQRRKIESLLNLAELRWISVLHGQSLESELLPQFRRRETSVFITMTRLCSHQFGPQVRAWCREFAKVYVELPGGYGVEQIAHQVVAQASGELLAAG